MKNLQRLITVVLFSLSPVTVYSHGGVSMEDDVCVITLGKLKAHFTGYQPEYRATQEFCEDIPVVGKSIFVLDFISNELRDMYIDFRVIKDVNNIGNNAVLADLGGPKAIEAATIFYQEKAIFPRGTLTANYNFSEEGRYIGLVTAYYEEDAEGIISVFPFQVGIFDYWKYIIPILVIILISSAVFGVLIGMNRKKQN
jgi:hypothetical protein